MTSDSAETPEQRQGSDEENDVMWCAIHNQLEWLRVHEPVGGERGREAALVQNEIDLARLRREELARRTPFLRGGNELDG